MRMLRRWLRRLWLRLLRRPEGCVLMPEPNMVRDGDTFSVLCYGFCFVRGRFLTSSQQQHIDITGCWTRKQLARRVAATINSTAISVRAEVDLDRVWLFRR